MTRHVSGLRSGARFAPAELLQFDHGGDLAWYGYRRPHFLVWGEQVEFRCWIWLPWRFHVAAGHDAVSIDPPPLSRRRRAPRPPTGKP